MLPPTYLFHFRSEIGMRVEMGTKRFETVFDYSKWGCGIGVSCACGHTALLDPKTITKVCINKGLDTRMPAIRARLRCGSCGSRNVQVAPQERD